MRIDKKWQSYLYDKKFSSGAKFEIAGDNMFSGRIDALLDYTGSGKRIIHLGACDHLPLIDKKIRGGEWLHKRFMERHEVIGFDIAEKAVRHCNRLGYDNIHHLDMLKDAERVRELLGDKKWDYIMAGEMVEHLIDPVGFLSEMNRLYHDTVDRIIITVPNAFYYQFMLFAIKGMEHINTDHKFWFTPYTICKVAACAGMEPEEMFFPGVVGEHHGLLKMIFRFYKNPLITGNNIVLVAKLVPPG